MTKVLTADDLGTAASGRRARTGALLLVGQIRRHNVLGRSGHSAHPRHHRGHGDRPRDLIACRQRHLAHPLPQITFTGYASDTGNAPAGQVSLPATAAEGETAVLFATLGVGPATLTAPEGWAQISGKSINGITGAVFTKTVTAADLAAPQVPVTWAGGTAKYTLSLATYEGVGGEHPV